MKIALQEMAELTEKSLELCPWIATQNIESYANELFNESQELKIALENNDIQNIKEEIGDILWDALVLAKVAEREGLFSAQDVVMHLNAKIKRRKPFLLSGEKISIEEATKLWAHAKQQEKTSSDN